MCFVGGRVENRATIDIKSSNIVTIDGPKQFNALIVILGSPISVITLRDFIANVYIKSREAKYLADNPILFGVIYLTKPCICVLGDLRIHVKVRYG